MPRFMLDTSCIVAIVNNLHPHHQSALDEFNRRLMNGETLVVATHTLVEAYSVLTRSPLPQQLSAQDAVAVLEATLLQVGELATLEAEDYTSLIRHAPADQVVGGRVYDAMIAACAKKAMVDILLTFNDRHFRQFEDLSLSIVVPQAANSGTT
jgi:predicted nucleic acid-binding protein